MKEVELKMFRGGMPLYNQLNRKVVTVSGVEFEIAVVNDRKGKHVLVRADGVTLFQDYIQVEGE